MKERWRVFLVGGKSSLHWEAALDMLLSSNKVLAICSIVGIFLD